MARNPIVFVFAISLALASCSSLPDEVADAYHELPEQLDYNLHVKPILSDKCFACHGPDKAKQKAGLRLDLQNVAFAALPENPTKVAIVPGDLKRSEVFHRILSPDPEYRMPTPESHLDLAPREKAILIKWIEDGAVYKPHWAFVKPEAKEVPKTRYADRAQNPIDNFVFHKLEAEKLEPSPEADKELLLRRLSLDLTGLPPTLEEIDAFINDAGPDAYEKQVDRLLRSVHYGEKMAVDWLDLARFADTHGYTVDRIRDMSPYRDWVIKSFNRNDPYDQFIHWQLAGDLMPSPTREMIVATAFNRNHAQNMEGGIIEEEFQAEYVVDRTNTLGEAFLGLSVGCARCHDHKYDPLSQKNYYELFSFFNNVKEAGQISWDDALPTPTLMLPNGRQEKILAFLDSSIAQQEKKVRQTKDNASGSFNTWLHSTAFRKLAKEKIPQSGLVAYYTFDDASLKNNVNPRQAGEMRQQAGLESPVFENGNAGKVLTMNGDIWLDLKDVGIFRRSDPFSVGLWVYIPGDLKEGVIFHKSNSERLYNYRGYHVYIKNNKLEVGITHTAPSNAITKLSKQDVPRDQWFQLTMTYDGSSRAAGTHLYLDGAKLDMETTMDQLTKDILFYWGQPALQIGAWDRGWGLKHGKVDEVVVYTRELTPLEARILARKEKFVSLTDKPVTRLTEEEKSALESYYLAAVDTKMKSAQSELKRIRTLQADSAERVSELMVMQEMPVPRKTYVLQRGNYDAPGEEVFPNTPSSILPYPSGLPKNRWGLAQWLTREDHPLTARVAVNHFWQNFFGTGLVKTTEDFGNQGELPSHPELLDWLAIQFRESGWNVKAFQKLIVMSATYRQDSRATTAAREKDPENRLLSHGPANRMSAEMIRDNALAASGLLQKTIGGKSVKPYQPDGLWQLNNTHYTQDTGPAVYRRSLYVIVKRTVPNPTLSTFDAPTRAYCVVRRQKTNTPLQSLVTLNDPTFVEAACVLGEQMSREQNIREAISQTYRKLTGRTPVSKEVDLLFELQQTSYRKFQAHPEKTKGWLTAGQYVVDRNLDTSLVAANTVVASTILNSDATLTKR